VKRGDQPVYYYGLMTPLYEFMPLILGLLGAAWLALKGDALRRWLLFWTGAIFVGLSVAGEKMPWLEVHIALPLVLVAAVTLAAMIERLRFEGRDWLDAAAVALLAAAGTLLLLEGSGGLRVAGVVLYAGVGGWGLMALVRDGRQAFARATLALSVALLLTLTARDNGRVQEQRYARRDDGLHAVGAGHPGAARPDRRAGEGERPRV
jgi:predicted membrane-bound mannosyltransferase